MDEKEKEIFKLLSETNKNTDRVNFRLSILCIILIIALFLEPIVITAVKDGMYFFSPYQYPSVDSSQIQSDENSTQEQKINIK